MQVPFLDLKAQFRTIKEEIIDKIKSILETQRFALGPEVEALEKEIASKCEVKEAIGVSSGTDALLVSLMALGIKPGDEIITTPFTFFATAGVIARLQAKPVFCDIDPVTFNLDPEKLDHLLKKIYRKERKNKVKGIIPVHLYGQCADMDKIIDLAKSYGLFVLEDAAQAISADYPSRKGPKKAGSMGLLGILSFYPTKNLGGYGDGGMVLTNHKGLAEKIRQLRVHGETKRYYYRYIGGNFRLDALQAGVLRVKLPYLELWQEKRRAVASQYEVLFENSGLIDKKLVTLPQAVYKKSGLKNYHTYHQFVVRVKKRDQLQKFLKEKGIETAIFYPRPLHLQRCFAYLGYQVGDLPNAEKAAREVLALPIYAELSFEQQIYLVNCIKDFYQSRSFFD
ncbi:MAG: DegT/DnrJ/EryC1/StrS family aminotransferase [Candidatus Aminicenantes bacterium]|nr:DegT/DnrJ/EryC1/StrS family aminotransferase [Candidatus Aminicenantes bacterium]